MATFPLMSAAQLAARLGEPDLVVVDCRFTLGQPGAGRERYLAGHLPGAAFLDLDTDLSGEGGGRHPLPSPDDFAAAARRAGISDRSLVVSYDEEKTGGAARLWWLLRHFGHERAAVLDGGLAAWDGPLRGGEETVEPGDLTAHPRAGDTVDADDVLAHLEDRSRLLLDARAPERYRGELEPIDAAAGHIPGARNTPYTSPLPPEIVAAPEDLVVYCGSGVTACVVLLDLAAAGRDARLYPGSWSDWSTRGLPVATGVGQDDADADQ